MILRMVTNPPDDPVRQTVANKIAEHSLEMADISRQLGMSHSYIQQFLKRGSPRRIPEELRHKLAGILGVEEALLRGSGGGKSSLPGMGTMAPAPVPDVPGLLRDLPVREGAICGEDGAFDFESQTADLVPRPRRLVGVSGAYALYIRGDSMSPWKEHGELIYVHPGIPVRPSDYVVVQLKPARGGEAHPAYIKRLVGQTDREIKLEQFNPKKYLRFQRLLVVSLHRVMKPEELLGA